MLFIEGTRDDTNGDLKQGFTILLKKKLDGKMPTIKMADGKTTAVDKFKNTQYDLKPGESIDRFLLVDLDASDEKKTSDIQKYDLVEYLYKSDDEQDLKNKKQRCFYMIQEMESWFISQPEILKERYGAEILKRLPMKKAAEIEHPDEKLNEWLRPLGKEYHKVKDGVWLLKKLDLDKLMIDFPDVKNLVEELEKA